MKVAHIATADVSLRYLLLNQLRAIQAAGYDVCGVSAAGQDVSAVQNAGIRHVAIPLTRKFDPFGDLRAFIQLYRVLRRERFTIVHTHTPKAALLGQYAAALARVPLRVHTIHGLYFPGHMNPKMRWAYVLLERITMLLSRHNFSQNPEDIPVAVREHICRSDRIELLGNGIDVRAFDSAKYSPERRHAIRQQFGFAPHHIVIGMVARLVAEKGYLEMFRAAQIVRERSPEARFLFIGGIEDKPDAIRPATLSEWKIDDIAVYGGYRTDIADCYAAMDIFALPSHREGFPRAPMEAASMALPIVVTDVRGCRQTVDDGVTGLLVPPRNPDALARALMQLIASKPLRERFGRAGREKAVAEFDEGVVFARVLAAYERLLQKELNGRVRHEARTHD